MLENSHHELCYDMSILIDLTIHSNRIDQVTPDRTIKEECVADEAIFNSHNLRSTTTGKL